MLSRSRERAGGQLERSRQKIVCARFLHCHPFSPTGRGLDLPRLLLEEIVASMEERDERSSSRARNRVLLALADLLKVRHHTLREQLHRMEDRLLWHRAPVKHEEQMSQPRGVVLLYFLEASCGISED